MHASKGLVLPVRPPPAVLVRPRRRARRSLAGEGRLVRAARRVAVRSSVCTSPAAAWATLVSTGFHALRVSHGSARSRRRARAPAARDTARNFSTDRVRRDRAAGGPVPSSRCGCFAPSCGTRRIAARTRGRRSRGYGRTAPLDILDHILMMNAKDLSGKNIIPMPHELQIGSIVARDILEAVGELLPLREQLLEIAEAARHRLAPRIDDPGVRQHQVDEPQVPEIVGHLVDEERNGAALAAAVDPRAVEVLPSERREILRAPTARGRADSVSRSDPDRGRAEWRRSAGRWRVPACLRCASERPESARSMSSPIAAGRR